jgi:colicin import membrane protein
MAIAKKKVAAPATPVAKPAAEVSEHPQAKVWDRAVTDRYKAFAAYVEEQTGRKIDPQVSQVTQALYGKFQKTDTNVTIRKSISETKAEADAARKAAAEERAAAKAAKEAAAAEAKANKPAAKKAAAKPAEKTATVTPIKPAKKVAAKKATTAKAGF